MSHEVGFLYECIKAGMISKEQAQEMLSSSGTCSNDQAHSSRPTSSLVQRHFKPATVCGGISPQSGTGMYKRIFGS